MQGQVLTTAPFDQTFSYEITEELDDQKDAQGQLVIVPFRKRLILGVFLSLQQDSAFKGDLKSIENFLSFTLPLVSLKFIEWVSHYTLIPQGSVLKMVISLPKDEYFKALKDEHSIKPTYNFQHSVRLSNEQITAANSLIQSLNHFQPFVLDGVTGSGKTEVYLAVIEEVLKNQGQILVLLPEIALTSQWLNRFERRFGSKPMIWHSNISLKKKRQAWKQVIEGHPSVVIGTRSALFLPFKNLKLIVVDEEQDDSYKQQDQNHYHARDMAVVRAQLSNIPIILASATPSLETMGNIERGKYKRLLLKNRFAGATLPQVQLVDMKGHSKHQWLSSQLVASIQTCLNNQEQILLFLNRKGYAPLTLCKECGHRFMCPACSVWLVQHKDKQKIQLNCHYCGFHQPLSSHCPKCQNTHCFVACGPGVERIYEEVIQIFPQARVLIATSDKLSHPKAMEALISSIHEKKVDILIGTQILAKGHHFPSLTLVGVIDADLGLNGGDLRAGEKTYQLLHQVAGRAGREQKSGHVLIQTYHPQHPLFIALQNHQREDYYRCEMQDRKFHDFPPYGFLAAIIVSGISDQVVAEYAKNLVNILPCIKDSIVVLGPVPSVLSRLNGRFRWRFLVKAKKPFAIQSFIKEWLNDPSLKKSQYSVRITIDIDPYSFL